MSHIHPSRPSSARSGRPLSARACRHPPGAGMPLPTQTQVQWNSRNQELSEIFEHVRRLLEDEQNGGLANVFHKIDMNKSGRVQCEKRGCFVIDEWMTAWARA